MVIFASFLPHSKGTGVTVRRSRKRTPYQENSSAPRERVIRDLGGPLAVMPPSKSEARIPRSKLCRGRKWIFGNTPELRSLLQTQIGATKLRDHKMHQPITESRQ